ncbi:MAG: 4'-phosphopantetheinyl transferase superfamily protein [Proteobacteria bacterium]|jgi:phosphopantetheinyl transferase|nr:4'-phosphopantetheinyl transferase superfamily protein [Desulfocapsa sp.]MBU3944531.1 4'-phosphopantetheinyl transferase superfamily protein [Pseudomonadota bacterium]MCG2744118.1 4'-phosphopantetheinyl transferase superfamily protein [Desulfobacteraceae bacterium]MBU3983395.1 4'-phosphopantetheinyl transferase superfamily protein [Pseudomonadota bacterium]MBU4028120.1 4'-phosphopantetheinyl transferase superfamily protein [Pseudomonadota bacterium]
MQLAPLPESLSVIISKIFAQTRLQATMLDLGQLCTLLHNGQEKAICEKWLHQVEEEKLNTLHYEKRHLEWLGGRICAKAASLRYLLGSHGNQSEQTSIPAPHLQIMPSASGRPFLDCKALPKNLNMPHISISHSKGYAMAVAASSHCGIDIQADSKALDRVKDRFCSKEEEELLGRELKQLQLPEHLTLLWAAKEAVKKATPLESMPGFLDLMLTHIQTTAKDGLVSRVPGTAQERPTAKEGLVSLEPGMAHERPSPKTESQTTCLFTLDFQEDRKKPFSPQFQFQVAVCLHQGYGIGLCVIPSQAGENNA